MPVRRKTLWVWACVLAFLVGCGRTAEVASLATSTPGQAARIDESPQSPSVALAGGTLIDGTGVIKITFSSSLPVLSPEEAEAIVETAHARGIPVTAHATNLSELQRALEAGVDDVAHMVGDRVPTRTIRHMVRTGVSWVPTLEALSDAGGANLRRFLAAGGQVALGTDAGYLDGLEIGMSLDEIALMAEAGMTPMQIIVAATRNGARICRLENELGTLQAGKVADVLVVDGDPLQDLRALTRVRLVMHEGVTIRLSTFTSQSLRDLPGL